MKYVGKDVVATGLVAVVVASYLVFVAAGHVWFVDTVAEMAVVVLVGGVASRLIGGRAAFHPRWPAVLANFATLGVGILALVTGSSAVLAVFVAMTAVLGVAAWYVRLRSGRSPTPADATSKEPLP